MERDSVLPGRPSSGTVSDTDPRDFEHHFRTISRVMHSVAGVHLTDKKRELVKGRIGKRIRTLGLDGFDDYVRLIRSEEGRGEVAAMVDILTTNKTSFFREPAHFDFLESELATGTLADDSPLRVWSAGCSTGEESYTIGLVLAETLEEPRRRRARVLATDINSRALEEARTGIYRRTDLDSVPSEMLDRHFRSGGRSDDGLRVSEAIRSMIRFARLNLVGEWPMSGPFDVILCRNVMIYFDADTRLRLIQRFTEILAPGGYFLSGHSESLNSFDHELEYVQPAVYRKGR